MPVAGSW